MKIVQDDATVTELTALDDGGEQASISCPQFMLHSYELGGRTKPLITEVQVRAPMGTFTLGQKITIEVRDSE